MKERLKFWYLRQISEEDKVKATIVLYLTVIGPILLLQQLVMYYTVPPHLIFHVTISAAKNLFQIRLFQVLMAYIIGPVMEETIFRLLPYQLLLGLRRAFRRQFQTFEIFLAIFMAFLFAAAHYLTINTTILPMEQFLRGILYWYVMSRYGFRYAIFAHVLNNWFYAMFQYLGHLLGRD